MYGLYVSSHFTPQVNDGRYRRAPNTESEKTYPHHFTSVYSHDSHSTTGQHGTYNFLRVRAERPNDLKAKVQIHYVGNEHQNLHLHFFPEPAQSTTPLWLNNIRVVDISPGSEEAAPHHSIVVHLHEAREVFLTQSEQIIGDFEYEDDIVERKVVDIYGRNAHVYLDIPELFNR